MPALPSAISDYLDAVTTSLQTGSDLGFNANGAAQNYLRAQDMSTVLDLLQSVLVTTSLTAVSGTTRSVTDGADTFVHGQQVGNTVTFAGNVTSALAGVTAVVSESTHDTLTFSSVLPAAPASGDTYTIATTVASKAITALRGGYGIADAPRGDVYGDDRLVRDVMVKLLRQLTFVSATGTLTFGGNPVAAETVTIGTKVYTFVDPLTDTDGYVLRGASASDSLDNLIAAINLGAGAGTTYATSTTANTFVTAAAGAGDTMDVTAKATGSTGNSIATTTDVTGGSWGAATLTGGTESTFERRMGTMLTLAGCTDTVLVVDNRGAGNMRVDEFRGLLVEVSGERRRVVKNDVTTMTLTRALASAPSASTTVTIMAPDDMTDSVVAPSLRVHPGQQPSDNIMLGHLISLLQAAVVAYTLPT